MILTFEIKFKVTSSSSKFAKFHKILRLKIILTVVSYKRKNYYFLW